MFSYTPRGLPIAKRLQANFPVSSSSGTVIETANFDAAYTYNSEAKVGSVEYPQVNSYGPAYNYSYDSMGRVYNMTNPNDPNPNDGPVVTSATYGMANELLAFDYFTPFGRVYENRSYNSLYQLASINATMGNQQVVAMQYAYLYNIPFIGGNNGKICSSLDSIAGEQVTYSYDVLNRLSFAGAYANSGTTNSCAGSGSSTWSQSFLYDGFGNLTGKYSSGSPVPALQVNVDSNTNHITSAPYAYDNNGNMTTGPNGVLLAYDVENRLSSAMPCTGCAGSMYYTYDAQNRRIGSWGAQQNGIQNYTIYFYGVEGHLLGTYQASIATGNAPTLTVSTLSTQPYFGGRRLSALDRIGSDRSNGKSFYPYGEDKGTPGANDTWKFATYWRDSVSGLDYAMNRYYSSTLGRFMSPDRYPSARKGVPQSWNRYSYVKGDPVNRNDPTGKCSVIAGGIREGSGSDVALNQLATDISAISAYGYANTASFIAPVGMAAGAAEVVAAWAAPTNSVATVSAAILAAAQNPGPIDIFAFSGGAQLVTTALIVLPSSVTSRVQNLVYLDPGFIGGLATTGSTASTTVAQGAGFYNWAVSAFGNNTTLSIVNTSCDHNAGCELDQIRSIISQLQLAPCPNTSVFSNIGPSDDYFWFDSSISEVSSTMRFGEESADSDGELEESVVSSITYYELP